MALAIVEFLRAVIPNIGLIINADAISYRIGVEDVNSDEVLTAVEASATDLAALEVINTAIRTAVQGIQAVMGAVGVAADVDGLAQAQRRYIGEAIDGLLTGIILAAGTAVIGRVLPLATVETPFTGTGNVVVGTHNITPGAVFKLTEVELHLSAAPTTGTQNLVITLDDGLNAAYDLVILTIDLVANAVIDLVITPNKTCKATDVITAAWTNTDGRTFGLKFKHELV